jgi:hypothetical protein
MLERLAVLLATSGVPKRHKIGESLLKEAKRRIEEYLELDMVLGACLFHPLIDWKNYPFNAEMKSRAIVSCFFN